MLVMYQPETPLVEFEVKQSNLPEGKLSEGFVISTRGLHSISSPTQFKFKLRKT
jgi:hypothetical protein